MRGERHVKNILSRNDRNSNTGFTLVEIIVVMVLIAIFAAIAIPTMNAYIDKARQGIVTANEDYLVNAVRWIDLEGDLPGQGVSGNLNSSRALLINKLNLAVNANNYVFQNPYSRSKEILTQNKSVNYINNSKPAPAVVVSHNNNNKDMNKLKDKVLFPMKVTQSNRVKYEGIMGVVICKKGYIIYNYCDDKIRDRTDYYYD